MFARSCKLARASFACCPRTDPAEMIRAHTLCRGESTTSTAGRGTRILSDRAGQVHSDQSLEISTSKAIRALDVA